jgi:hypothetical protein
MNINNSQNKEKRKKPKRVYSPSHKNKMIRIMLINTIDTFQDISVVQKNT